MKFINLKKKSFVFLLVFSVICCLIGGYFLFKKPTVSIVMPVYNGEKYLEKTVLFLLHSDFRDFEFIIIDDGSKDGSYKKLEQIAKMDKRIKLYKNEKNMGIVKTRNKGMSLAKGKYIAPMDQDDWSMPERLGASVKYLNENPLIDVVDVGTILMKDYFQGRKVERYGAISYLLKTLEFERENYTKEEIDENIKLSLLFSLAVPTQSGAMMRKEFLEKNNIKYREGILYSDDYYLYLDMVKKGANFHHIDEVMHIYNDVREHEKGFNVKQIEETNNAKRELFAFVGLNFDDYVQDWNNLEMFVCRVIDDLLKKSDEELYFNRVLLEKNKKFVCGKEN